MADKKIKRDLLKDRWTLFSIKRKDRPVSHPIEPNYDKCVFCPGNEWSTPPSPLTLCNIDNKIQKQVENEEIRLQNWRIRVVPNLYPVLDITSLKRNISSVTDSTDTKLAIGHHEIIIESPNHTQRIHDMSIDQIQNIFIVCKDRMYFFYSKPYVKYVSFFKNYRIESGASQKHPHSQIVTLPLIPSIIQQELKRYRQYSKKKSSCIFCDIIHNESSSNRLIWQNKSFTVITPSFSIFPYEFWIIPNRHCPAFTDTFTDELRDLAIIFKSAFKAISTLLNDPPYNYWIHTTPKNKQDFHWHIEILPKTGELGGLEQSTGVYVNTVLPRDSAKQLRKLFK